MKREIEKVLIVDDDPIALLIAEQSVRKLHLSEKTTLVKNGQEAVDFILSRCKKADGKIICPDLIFLDYNMPVMDGKEFIKKLSQEKFSNWNTVVIVVTSTFLTEQDKVDFLNLGAKEFLTKPFTYNRIKNIFERYFGPVSNTDYHFS